MLSQRLEDVAGSAGAGRGRRPRSPDRLQEPGEVGPDGEGNRGDPRRRHPTSPGRVVHFPVPQRESSPRDVSGKTEVVEPLGAVALHPSSQNGLPGPGRQFESLELVDHGEHAQAPFPPCPRCHVLPSQQEPDEVLSRDRLDLSPQPLLGVRVDPGEEAPGAELLRTLWGGEVPSEGESLGLEPSEGDGHIGFREARRLLEVGDRRRSPELEVPPEHLGGRRLSVQRGSRDR